MVPPPPSQPGRFKPRKPAKKIRIGAGVMGEQPDSSSVSAAAVAAPSETTTTGGRGRDNRRGGPRGGGRGRGRGRGRAPVQQGQVFFTGTPAPVTSSRRSAGGRGRSSRTRGKKTADTVAEDEVVVGTLEDDTLPSSAVQPDAPKSNEPTSRTDSKTDGKQKGASPKADQATFTAVSGEATVDKHTYDSDSSEEESLETIEGRKKESTLQPLVLPFPSIRAPVGIGGTHLQQAPYTTEAQEDGDQHMDIAHDAPSPFVSLENLDDLKSEQDSWFLVQLPTRLPPLKQQVNPDDTTMVKMEEDVSMQDVETAEVSTPSVQVDAFDNALTNCVPGKLGKIKVYKSGKTVLAFEDADGNPTVQMNVTEGLTCSFRQEAVVIDKDKSEYTPLGSVQKSVVVTPDLSRAFTS